MFGHPNMIVPLIHLSPSSYDGVERTNNLDHLRRDSKADERFSRERTADGFVGFLQVDKHISNGLFLVGPNFGCQQPENMVSVVDR